MRFPIPNPCEVLFPSLRRLPPGLHGKGLALVLNRLLQRQLAEGELDFLRDKTFTIAITDVGIEYRLRLRGDRFEYASTGDGEDVRFSGDLYTFLLLATQQEDADSLFFQRRLRMQGDTPTGLHLKNFIDAAGDSFVPPTLRQVLERFSRLYAGHCVDEALPV